MAKKQKKGGASAPSNVVPIRQDVKPRKKNRKQDMALVEWRRVAAYATPLRREIALRKHMPCHNLRVAGEA